MIVEEQYSEAGLTLRAISLQLGTSPNYLGKLFVKESGQSFRRYLITIRMDHACRLLRESDASVQQIAYDVGFTDPSNFCHTFRSTFSMTPGDYRDGIRASDEWLANTVIDIGARLRGRVAVIAGEQD
jgi:two-component system response regulator YesN